MSNRLPSTRTTQALSPAEVSRAEARIEALHGRLDPHPVHPTRYCVSSERAATTAERHALSVVAERLEGELHGWRDGPPDAPPTRDRIAVDATVTRILAGFEQGRGRSEEAEDVLVGEYIAGLRDLPLVGILAAADRFRSGTTLIPWTGRWRPSPAEFAAEVRKGLIPARTKLIHVRRILEAEVLTPRNAAEQAKVEKAAAAWLTGREALHDAGAPAPSPAEVEAAREASLREAGAAAARAMDPRTAARLMGRLGSPQGTPG